MEKLLAQIITKMINSKTWNWSWIIIAIINVILAYLILGFFREPKFPEKPSPPSTVPKSTLKYRDYTISELRPFDGRQKPEILISVDQRIFDVTSSRHYYGPDGGYSSLAGRDASRGLATHKILTFAIDELQEWDPLNDLTVEQRKTLNDWVDFFDRKYPRVGTLVPLHAWAGSDLEDDPDNARPRGKIISEMEFEKKNIL